MPHRKPQLNQATLNHQWTATDLRNTFAQGRTFIHAKFGCTCQLEHISKLGVARFQKCYFCSFLQPFRASLRLESLLCYHLHKLNDHERVVSLILSTALATPHQRESAGPALWVPCATQRCDLHRLPNQTRAFSKTPDYEPSCP
jgi:hypothetical protein